MRVHGTHKGATPQAAVVRHDGVSARDPDGVQVIARAAQALRCLAPATDGLSVADVARGIGVPRSTTYRILRALDRECLVRRTDEGRYTLGAELESLAGARRSGLRVVLSPHLLRLRRLLGETVSLAVLSGAEALFVEQIDSPQTLRVVAEPGTRVPAHAAACGKALLAALPADEADRLLPDRLERLTPNTVTSRSALLGELELVRRCGTAIDIEELTTGVCSMATVVRDHSGGTAAVAVVMPAARFEARAAIEAVLLRERAVIQRELGDPSLSARRPANAVRGRTGGGAAC